MVVVQVQGGLGNQLFQLAAGFCVARQNSDSHLLLDASRVSFGTDKSRRLQVLNFNLFSPELKVDVWGESFRRLAQFGPTRLSSALAISASKIHSKLRFKNYFYFSEDNPKVSLEQLDSRSILNGYFNDFSIVERAFSLGLRNNLELKSQPSQWLSDNLNEVDFETSIAIHVRLGDYLKFPQIFGKLSEDYYLTGLEEVSFNESQQVFLFSDQPNLVANHLPKISSYKNCKIVRQPSAVPSYENFFMMSQFKNIICANSTFSMWAAWFNQGPEGRDKRVVIPTPYLLDRADMVTPSSWRKIPRG